MLVLVRHNGGIPAGGRRSARSVASDGGRKPKKQLKFHSEHPSPRRKHAACDNEVGQKRYETRDRNKGV